jgi:sugar/nucleoside kinase (ribokinase family)
MSDPIRPEDIPQAFRSCDIIYICPMDEDVLVEDLAGVTALGKISAVDLGGYGGVHMSKDRRQAIADLAEYAIRVASHFDIVKASDEDAISIFRQDDPLKASRKLLASGPQVVVITLGANGALVSTSEKHWHVPPVSGNVIDATGGGDTFMAGFLSEYIQSQDPLRSAQRGCATAISVIEKTGGVLVDRMPTSQQVQERINQNYF